jgi:hypothetical protein
MIRARLSDGRFLFGLDAENVRRLVNGQPIAIELEPMGGTDKILIMFGQTYGDILNELETAMGEPLPEPISEEELEAKYKRR